MTVHVDDLDHLLEVVADFADLKVPHTLGHSRGVARLAVAGAEAIGLDAAAVLRLRRAALLHGLRRAGISNQIWDKPGPLSGEEWERVRLHPYLTGPSPRGTWMDLRWPPSCQCGGYPSELPVVWPRGLTGREVDVLPLACQGMSIRQVARRLVISPKTVDRHLQNSYPPATSGTPG